MRLVFRAAAGFVLVVLAIGIAAGLWRAELAEVVLQEWLEGRGVTVAEIEVRELGTGRATVTALRLGEGRRLSADSIALDYTPGALLQGDLRRMTVTVTGAELRVDLTGTEQPLGELGRLLSDEQDTGAPAQPLAMPRIRLADSRVLADTPYGTLTVSLDGSLEPAPEGQVTGMATFAVEGDSGTASGNIRIAQVGGTTKGEIVLDEGSIAMASASIERLEGSGSFTLVDNRPTEAEGRLRLAGLSLASPETGTLALESVDMEGSLAPEKAKVTLRLEEPLNRLDATLEADISDPLGSPSAILEAMANMNGEARLLRALPLPVMAGQAWLDARLEGPLPRFAGDVAFMDAAANWAADADAEGRVVLTLDKVDVSNGPSGLTGAFGFEVRKRGPLWRFRVPEDARIGVGAIETAKLAAIGLPETFLEQLEGAFSFAVASGSSAELTFPVSGDGPSEARLNGGFNLDLKGESDASLEFEAAADIGRELELAAIDLTGDGRLQARLAGLTVPNTHVQRATLDLPLTVALSSGNLNVTLAGEGASTLEGLRLDQGLAATSPLNLRLVEGRLRTSVIGDPNLEVVAVIEGDRFAAELGPGDGAVEKLRVTPGTLRIEVDPSKAEGTAAIEMQDGALDVIGYGLALSGIGLQLQSHLAAPLPSGTIRIGRIADAQEAPRFTALDFKGSLEAKDGTLRVSGLLSDASDRLLVDLSGRHETGSGVSSAQVKLRPLEFAPGELQPVDLFPALAEFTEVAGSVAGEFEVVDKANGPLTGKGTASIGPLSFTSVVGRVQDLALDLTLAGLFPPQSAPRQELTIAHVEAGVPITDARLVFELSGSRLEIDGGQMHVAGGRLEIQPTVIDPTAEGNTLSVKVVRLPLQELFAIVDVEGLSGSGELSGTLPITFAGNDLSIDEAELAAVAPGVIHFRSEQAKDAIGGSGEQVALALRALENFQYDELEISLTKSVEEDVTLYLGLEGKNPDVLEGHPFRFNINLETNIGQLLDAFLKGYQLSRSTLERVGRGE